MGRLDGRVALITGAARGQGQAEAERFVAEGALVMIADDSIFLDPDTKTMGAQGNPKELLKHTTDPKLKAFLTRGEFQLLLLLF